MLDAPTHLPADVVATVEKMAEFKVRNGEQFEIMIRAKEANNPKFSFLFDPSSPGASYYQLRVAQLQKSLTPSASPMQPPAWGSMPTHLPPPRPPAAPYAAQPMMPRVASHPTATPVRKRPPCSGSLGLIPWPDTVVCSCIRARVRACLCTGSTLCPR